jgi:hypothetical protein
LANSIHQNTIIEAHESIAIKVAIQLGEDPRGRNLFDCVRFGRGTYREEERRGKRKEKKAEERTEEQGR